MMVAPNTQLLTKDDYPMMWGADATSFEANGDYQWMSEQIGQGRVLEVGCGIGLATRLLAKRGPLMSIDHNHNCIATAERLLASSGLNVHRITEGAMTPLASIANAVSFLEGDVFDLLPWQKQAIESFAPKWVVCWLVGSHAAAIHERVPNAPLNEAIALYREDLEVALAALAGALPSVQGIQFVHRVQMQWHKKDEGRVEYAKIFSNSVYPGTGFTATSDAILFRKWNVRDQSSGIRYASQPSLPGAIPCLVSILGTK